MKEQLLQIGLQHAQSLKEATAAGEAKVEEAKKQFAEAQEQLRQEVEQERKLVKLEQEKNNELTAIQASTGQMIRDTDAKALSRCFFSFSYKLSSLTVVFSYRLLFISPHKCSRILRYARRQPSPSSVLRIRFLTPAPPGP
jgi:hypothetical protein